jgi:hypothetical protein
MNRADTIAKLPRSEPAREGEGCKRRPRISTHHCRECCCSSGEELRQRTEQGLLAAAVTHF